ncbi:DsbE family thiol:disulfide interchange protein [Candidatus Pelagibacter sp.]|nr:DsbE family thiol:disulfide interchange protein [Candidatus Pelagibacter sp.]
MKSRITSFILITSLILTFVIFYKGLNKSILYEPKSAIKDIPEFTAIVFYENKEVNSKKIFNQNKFYLLNIWASWCVPCRDEHSFLLNLGNNDKLEIIGLNYKDDSDNAKKFINDLGNPYKKILLDNDGTKAIEWGAFGVPESFLIYQNKIIKKFIGPLNYDSVEEIKKLIK